MTTSAIAIPDKVSVRVTRVFLRHAAAISNNTNTPASHQGGEGIRHSGSHRTLNATTRRDSSSSHAQIAARLCDSVAIVRNPSGSNAPSAGTTIAFAVMAETGNRWKYT